MLPETWIEQACLAEVLAPKPGNVSPLHDFADTKWLDFVKSAEIIAPILAKTRSLGIGQTVYNSVENVLEKLGKNTNLGIILILAPLLMVPEDQLVHSSISTILDDISLEETKLVFEAISLAQPGGLGTSQTEDVHATPTLPLREVMKLAQHRDLIAQQYVNGFQDVCRWASALRNEDFNTENWLRSVVELQLRFLIEYPDSLISRKCGIEVAREASLWALKINFLGGTYTPDGREQIREFHKWLTDTGNKKNPGTTADLIVGTLFVAQRDYGLKLLDRTELLKAVNEAQQLW